MLNYAIKKSYFLAEEDVWQLSNVLDKLKFPKALSVRACLQAIKDAGSFVEDKDIVDYRILVNGIENWLLGKQDSTLFKNFANTIRIKDSVYDKPYTKNVDRSNHVLHAGVWIARYTDWENHNSTTVACFSNLNECFAYVNPKLRYKCQHVFRKYITWEQICAFQICALMDISPFSFVKETEEPILEYLVSHKWLEIAEELLEKEAFIFSKNVFQGLLELKLVSSLS